MLNNPITLSSDMDVELFQSMGDDTTAIMAARVSTLNDTCEDTNLERFIDFLIRNRHMSPFEHSSFTFVADVPIFVMRELMRHRTMSFNEQSGRYVEMRPKFYLPSLRRPLVQHGATGKYIFVEGSSEQQDMVELYHRDAAEQAWAAYQIMLDQGVAREVARNVLPVSIYSKTYITVKTRNLMQFLSLRTSVTKDTLFPSYPLYEIAEMAAKMEASFKEKQPITWAAWNKHGRVGL